MDSARSPQGLALDHELLDFGAGERLERFGPRRVIRPHPTATSPRAEPSRWEAADLWFRRDHGWAGPGLTSGPWSMAADGLTLELRPTPAGQVGVFPEHAGQLEWLLGRVPAGTRPAVLHLFAYTGLLSLALAAAGAVVTHVDAARPAVEWARHNARASGLGDRPIRWIKDDARGFVAREARRGHRYAGIVLDPPTYGHGPGSRAWAIEGDLPPLLAACRAILDAAGFVLLTAHTPGFGPATLAGRLKAAFPDRGGSIESGELTLSTADGRRLTLGAFARTAGGAS